MRKLDNYNKKYFNYSIENGTSIEEDLKNKLTLKTRQVCSSCGNYNNGNLYCKNCGKSLNDEVEAISTNYDLKRFNIDNKSILLTSITSVLILFFISLGLKLLMSFSFGELINFINPLHIMLGINLGSINLNAATMMNSSNINIHLGLLIIGLIPVFSISIANIIFIKNKNIKDVLYNSIGVGIVYGILLVIISILSSTSASISYMMNYGISLSYEYNIIELFINGFMLGFISTYLVGYKKQYFGQNVYLDIFKVAINCILALYIVIFIILLGISLVDNNYLYELGLYNYSSNSIFIISQLASYLLIFANIIPVVIGNGKLSILSIMDKNILFDIKLMLIAIILLSILILIITGYNLRKIFKKSSFNVVLIFSISYSIILTIISSFTMLYINGNMSLLTVMGYPNDLFMGAGIITTFIISLIYSYIIVKIGYTLSDFEEVETETI